jgi:hypothetical protein
MFGYTELLKSAFYNMEEDARTQIGANFTQVDEYIDDYLMFKGLKELPGEKAQEKKKEGARDKYKDHTHDMLLAQVEILSFKIEAAHLERVIMSWEQPNTILPITTKGYHIA